MRRHKNYGQQERSNFLSKLTDRFGALVSFFQGSGTITHEKCVFEIGQTANGAIVIYIDNFQKRERQKIELIGTVEDGRELEAQGDVLRFDDISTTECFLQSSAPFHSSEPFHFTVGELVWADAAQVKFAVTNFVYRGNDADSNDWMTGIGRLNVELTGTKVSFEKAENYTNFLNPVGKGESTEVTSHLIIEASGKSRDEILELANSICALLTIGSGRKISWISYSVCDSSYLDLYSYHEYRFTDKRNGRELIDFANGNTAARYLEQCFPAYMTHESKNPGMLHGIGLMLIDANSKGFMRTRALIICSILDALSNKESSDRHLKQRIRSLVDTYRVPVTKCKTRRCGSSNQGCDPDCEIGLFVKNRNSIVHNLQFPIPTQGESSEYYSMLSLFHRLLLRILDYESYFVDVRYRYHPTHRINLLRPSP